MAKTKFQRTYHRSGRLHLEEPFVGGKLHGVVRMWHKNGRIASQEPYANGLRHGVAKHWSARGKLLGSYRVTHGTGTALDWHDNGQLLSEISLIRGEFTGRIRHWLSDRTLAEESFLIGNHQVTRRQYQKACRKDEAFPRYTDDGRRPARRGRALERKQFELFVKGLLNKPSRRPAGVWLRQANAKARRSLGGFASEIQALRLVEQLIGAHVAVIAADIYSGRGRTEFSDFLLVELPKKKRTRVHIRSLCAKLPKKLRIVVNPEVDFGESHLLLALA